MRFRLLRRRLTISAPRMAVRSALPWPLRWALAAVMLGFCAAIGLWAFEFGKDIAGLDQGSRQQLDQARLDLARLQAEVAQLRHERDQAQSVANTADTLVTTAKASSEQLLAQTRQLEVENRSLRDDLAFFEKLIPATGAPGMAIRGLQAEPLANAKLRWQVLVIQARRDATPFSGQLDVVLSGNLNGKAWTASVPQQSVTIGQYARLEGELDLPPQVQLHGMTARLSDGSGVKATQSIKL